MHRFRTTSEASRLWIHWLLLLSCFGTGLAAVVFMFAGFILASSLLLMISLVMIACGAVCALLHLIWGRDSRCPLCRGALLASQGCARNAKARKWLGSHRLGVALPVLFSLRFRCPYCGEPCACGSRSARNRVTGSYRPEGWLLCRHPIVARMAAPCLTIWLLAKGSAAAMTITGYTSEANDRFSSGYPNSPVENTHPAFVGLGLDWAGVGWASNQATKSFGFLSPSHYLVARHFGGAANIRIFANDTLQTYSQAKVEDLGFGVVFSGEEVGDLSLGTLTNPIPATAGLPRYAVLDLNSSSTSNTPSAYNGLDLLLYGRGPDANSSTRIGEATISSVTVSGNNHYFTTTRDDVQLESGDSGSPAVHRWLNPAGGEEITLLGNHAAISSTSNLINFTGTHQVMSGLNTLMNDDGFALRVVGNPTNTWVGGSSTSINDPVAWGLGGSPGPPASAPSDRFVNFDGATAGSGRLVTINSNHNLRGLYFLPTGSDNLGFSFEGSDTLTIGRGGITNYDESRQTFDAALALGSSQIWDGGQGGITAGNIATNGNLLEITTQGESRITGEITGNGKLALSGGTLELTGASTYSGTTWVHDGTLLANNTSGSATGAGDVIVSAGGTLAGEGFIQGSAMISGIVAPGNSIGTLTVGDDVIWNAGAPWLFELGTPALSLEDAGLGLGSQDLLLIEGTGSGFLKGTGSGWGFDFAGTGQAGWYRLVDWDGMTTFNDADFAYYNLASGLSGQFLIDDSSSALYFTVIPEPGTGLFVLVSLALWVRRRR